MSQFKQKNGTWAIKCMNNQTGKQTTIRRNPYTNAPFKTRGEAKEFELIYLKSQIDIHMKFSELYERYKRDLLSRNPYDVDLISWHDRHLYVFDRRKITSLKPADIKKFQQDKLLDEYSIVYINKLVSVIKTILNFGVKEGFMDKNICANVPDLTEVETTEKLKYWTVEEFTKVIQSIPECYTRKTTDTLFIKHLLMFAFYSSMRNGEIRALKWKDVDFKNNLIHINRHIVKHNKTKPGRKNNNYHILYMDEKTKKLLLEIKARYENIPGFNKECYVFPGAKGGIHTPMSAGAGNKYIKKLAEFNDLEHITFHGMRHTSASYLLSIVGLSIYEVADHLGDSVEVTMRVYAQFLNEAKKMAANKIDMIQNEFDL